MNEEREPPDQEAPASVESDTPETDPAQAERDPSTQFAITPFCLVIAALLALFLPTYLSAYLDSTIGRIFVALLYIVAALFGHFGLFGFYIGLRERPELRRFLKGVLYGLLIKPLWVFGAPGKDASASVYFAAVLIVIAGLLHLLNVSWIGATGAAEVIAKLFIVALCILASIFVAVAVDGFVVKPILATVPSYQDEANLNALLQRIRNVVAAAITLAGLVLAIIEVF